jgi:hypothetical protein
MHSTKTTGDPALNAPRSDAGRGDAYITLKAFQIEFRVEFVRQN